MKDEIIIEDFVDNSVIELEEKMHMPVLENLTIIPSEKQQVFKSKKDGFNEIVVEGVNGDELTIIPTTEEQINEGLFDKVIVSGDSNLISENIKAGVSVFGIEGTAQVVGEETEELLASYMSSIDDSKGGNVTKLPNGITAIGDYAFYQRSNLAISEFPETVKSIGTQGLYGCTKLALYKLPDGLIELGTQALYNCTGLETMEVPAGISALRTGVMQQCSGLEKIVCKSSKISIAANACKGCSNLKIFAMPNIVEVPTLHNTNAFANTPIANGEGYIYVPDELVEQMKQATNWSTYADQIKPISELEVA